MELIYINIDDYENLCSNVDLIELEQKEVSQKLKKEAAKAKKAKKPDLFNI